jgi:hypothetical protein
MPTRWCAARCPAPRHGKTRPRRRLRSGRQGAGGPRPAPTRWAARTWPSASRPAGSTFDVALATPDMMGVVGRLGRILGRAGSCPIPSRAPSRSTSSGPSRKSRRSRRVQGRQDRYHPRPLWQDSFTPEQLAENLAVLMDAVNRARPSAAKGQYIRNLTLHRRWARHPRRRAVCTCPGGCRLGKQPKKFRRRQRSVREDLIRRRRELAASSDPGGHAEAG